MFRNSFTSVLQAAGRDQLLDKQIHRHHREDGCVGRVNRTPIRVSPREATSIITRRGRLRCCRMLFGPPAELFFKPLAPASATY